MSLTQLLGFILAFRTIFVYTVCSCGIKWDKVERRTLAGVLLLKQKVELMFLGQFRHNLDDKGRLTVPARFRDLLLADGAYVMQGFDQNLMVLTSPRFDTLSERVKTMSMTDPTARLLRRLLFSTAAPVEVDKAGRILLPQFLREHATLNSEAVVVGMGDYFEIWSPALWSAQAEMLGDAQANADRFSALSLSAA